MYDMNILTLVKLENNSKRVEDNDLSEKHRR